MCVYIRNVTAAPSVCVRVLSTTAHAARFQKRLLFHRRPRLAGPLSCPFTLYFSLLFFYILLVQPRDLDGGET